MWASQLYSPLLSIQSPILSQGAAETGSGKTLAYVIPLLARLEEEERKGGGPRALILAPTRELVIQVRWGIGVARDLLN